MFQRSKLRLCRAPVAITSLVVMAAVSLCGCDSEPARLSRQTTTVSDVPEGVMNAARQALPGVEFADAWKNMDKDNTLHSYEIRGRTKNGKIREVRVSPSGEILEME